MYSLRKRTGGASLFESKSTAEAKSSDTESNAVKVYEGSLGEAWPSDGKWLPRPLQQIVMSYLANHVDVNPKRYTRKQLDAFTLFETPFAGKAEIAGQIARHILAGERSKALSLIRDNPFCHECIAGARDDFGRYAEGTPLGLAAAAGNPELVREIRGLLSEEKANAQLHAQFPPGWEAETKERMNRYRNAAIEFTKGLKAEGELPRSLSFAEAIGKRKKIIRDYRMSFRPKPDDPAITTGLIVDPLMYPEIRYLFLSSQDNLGGWGSPEVRLLWGVGFQSLLGAGPAVLGQILIDGAGGYDSPGYIPPENLTFEDGAHFFKSDPDTGLGATYVVDFSGMKSGACEREVCDSSVWPPRRSYDFWKAYVEQQYQYCQAYAASGQTVNHDGGVPRDLSCNP